MKFLVADCPPLPAAMLWLLFEASAAPVRVFLNWNFSRIDDSFDWYELIRSVDVVLSAPVPGCWPVATRLEVGLLDWPPMAWAASWKPELEAVWPARKLNRFVSEL